MRSTYYKLAMLIVYGLVCIQSLRSQVTVSFNAAISGQSLDGLSLAQIINSSEEDVMAKIVISVREVSAGTVLSASIQNAFVRRGSNPLDRAAFSNGRFLFGNNYHGNMLRQSGRFPEGEYEYCYEIEILNPKTQWLTPFFENCFVHQLQPMTPLLLIHPVDGDENCNTRPDFTWQPPLPLPATARCRLVVTEIRDKQDVAEAINFNIPVINQGNLQASQLMYPSQLPELKRGKKYAWQVTVYVGKLIIKKSEIWIYTIKCDEPNSDVQTGSYRELKEGEDGGFYIANNVLHFSINNPYSAGQLNYSIVSMADQQTPIKGLPDLKLLPGLNKYDVDLRDMKAFKNDQEYLLKIRLINGRELKLRFLFKTEIE